MALKRLSNYHCSDPLFPIPVIKCVCVHATSVILFVIEDIARVLEEAKTRYRCVAAPKWIPGTMAKDDSLFSLLFVPRRFN